MRCRTFKDGMLLLAKLKERDPLLIHVFVNNRAFPRNGKVYDDTSLIRFIT